MKNVLAGLIAAISVTNFLATANGWYYSVRWLDVPMHITAGAWIALAFYHFVYSRKAAPETGSVPVCAVSIIGIVAIVGITWEIYEFIIDVYVLKKYPALGFPGYVHFDTLKDLFDDLLGGALATVFLRAVTRKKENA